MFLITPNLPFMKKKDRRAPFYGLHSNLPIFLALILGYEFILRKETDNSFQHALAMLAGIVTPPLILGGSGGANLDQASQQYLISASLIVCGILSSIQIHRFHFYKTPYYLGTGLIRYLPPTPAMGHWLIAAWSERHLPLSLWPAGLSHNGMQMGLVRLTPTEQNSLVPKDTVQSSARLVPVHFLKSASALCLPKLSRRRFPHSSLGPLSYSSVSA